MNVTCPNCATVYRVDPAKVPEAGVRARCAVCSAVFAVNREGQPARAAEPVTAAVARAPREAAPSPQPEPPRAEPPRPEPARAESTGIETPIARPVPPSAPEPAKAPPPVAVPRPAGVPAPAAPAGGPPRPAAPARPAPVAAPAASAPTVVLPAAPPPAAPTPAPTTSPPTPARPAAGRPANPFLSQDPSLKARRLARALISDMVVYHPAKRQEGLRDGNLKELFEEEIKKSWEEYSDQVGRDVAESTVYFREALNEILAGGRQIF